MPLELKTVRSEVDASDHLLDEWENLWGEFVTVITNNQQDMDEQWDENEYKEETLRNGSTIYRVRGSTLRDKIDGDDGIYEFMEHTVDDDEQLVRYIGKTSCTSRSSLADGIACHM